MKQYLLILFFFYLISLTKVNAQVNLVPNGDFEIYSSIPTTNAQSNLAVGWNNVNGHYFPNGSYPYGSPDYFYNPLFGILASVGAINPFSGNGQMGLVTYCTIKSNYREYISTKLIISMIPQRKYNVSFYLTNGVNTYYIKGSNNFGIRFSKDSLHQDTCESIKVIPQIEIDTIIYFNNYWQKFNFNYKADSSYNFITIGNLRDDSATHYSQIGQGFAYFFIDKIEIIPFLFILGDSVICKGNSTTLKMDRDSIVKWADIINPNTILATDSMLTVSPTVTTTYYAYGVSDTVSFTVHVVNPPIINLGNDTTLCNGDSLLLKANIPYSSYLWQSSSTNSTYNVFTQGTYWVRVTIDSSCIATDTINVNYISPPPTLNLVKDTTLCDGIPISVTIPNGAYNILWYDGDTNNLHILNQAGIYYISISNKCGVVKDSIKLIYKNCDPYVISIPNSFTPNGDGLNDVFKIETLAEFSAFHLYIYNRWGEQIFYSEDKNKGWDGTFKGKAVPMGVYIYLVTGTIKDTNEQIKINGTVTVLR